MIWLEICGNGPWSPMAVTTGIIAEAVTIAVDTTIQHTSVIATLRTVATATYGARGALYIL